MSDDIFTSNDRNEAQSVVDTLVGEGKKYKTIEDLAKSRLEADSHIERLENENKLTREQMIELEKKADKEGTIASLIETIKSSNTQGTDEGNQPISDDDLSKKIDEILGSKTEKQTRDSNYKEATQAVLDKVNGDVEAAKSYVAERARQLGTTAEKLKALGEESPKAFKELMNVGRSTGSPGVTSIGGFKPPGDTVTIVDGHRTKAYYEAMKKEMGVSKYWSDRKLQAQYTKDAMALGDRFNSN